MGIAPEVHPLIDTRPLSKKEKSRLQELEGIVYKNFRAFYEVGRALAEIRDGRLYRTTHTTFEDYCKELWDMVRSRAQHYISAASVVDNLLGDQNVYNCKQNNPKNQQIETGDDNDENVNHGAQNHLTPLNEAQARPLTKLSPEDQIRVWKRAVETAPNGRVTAKHVARTVREVTGEDVKKVVRKAKTDFSDVRKAAPEFMAAFDAFLDQVQIAWDTKWKDTSRYMVLSHLDALRAAVGQDL